MPDTASWRVRVRVDEDRPIKEGRGFCRPSRYLVGEVPTTNGDLMTIGEETRRRWAARVCQLDAWARELRDRANDCAATFQQLDSASPGAELVFSGARDVLSYAADQVDQTAEALTMIFELSQAVYDAAAESRVVLASAGRSGPYAHRTNCAVTTGGPPGVL
jgi:hypothetical protein